MRPVHNLAYYHYEKRGEYEKAFELYHKALELEDNNRLILSLPHAKIAEYYERWKAFGKAAEHLDKALAIFPGFEGLNYRLADMLARAGNPERALTTIRPLVVKYPNSFSCNYLVARILLKMNDVGGTQYHLQRCLRISPHSSQTFLLMGIVLNRQGDWLTAEKFLQAVLERYPNDKRAQLWMIDCQLRRSDDIAAAGLALRFIEGVPLDQIGHFIENALEDDFMVEGSRERLASWITKQAKSLDCGKRDASISGNDGPSKQRHDL
jgi:tetratricopeptide (TPR) repeat protein